MDVLALRVYCPKEKKRLSSLCTHTHTHRRARGHASGDEQPADSEAFFVSRQGQAAKITGRGRRPGLDKWR